MSLRIVSNDPKLQKQREDLDRRYARYLHSVVDDVFTAATDEKDWSWPQLARAAGLSYSTVRNFGNRETRFPRHMTVWKLARAVGIPVVGLAEQTQTQAKVTLKRRAG